MCASAWKCAPLILKTFSRCDRSVFSLSIEQVFPLNSATFSIDDRLGRGQRTRDIHTFHRVRCNSGRKEVFGMKETLRRHSNRASIAFVQERNLQVRPSFCHRFIRTRNSDLSGCKLQAHERTTAHPARFTHPGTLPHWLPFCASKDLAAS
jgi:hypothetical protein